MPPQGSASSAVDWLLEFGEPAIRGMARRDLLGEPAVDDLARVEEGPLVRGLLAGQQAEGDFGGDPYHKWTGAHWRLVSLVELEIPAGEPRAMAAAERVLGWLTRAGGRPAFRPRGTPPRSHASVEGNALAVCSRLGLAADPRVRGLAEALVAWQWPDGGWNCSQRATGKRSSFHETHSAMWGLREYATATGDEGAASAARRAAELFLEHGLYRRHGTGGPIHPSWVQLHYPPYWHYDVLQALHLLRRMGLAADPRAADAVQLVRDARHRDGTWHPGGYWWTARGGTRYQDVVDWGRGGPNAMLTLNALRVLKAAGVEDGRPGA